MNRDHQEVVAVAVAVAESIQHGEESERLALAVMLQPRRAQLHTRLIELLTDSDFHIEQHKAIWRVITKLRNAGLPFDVTAINDAGRRQDEFLGGAIYLSQLLDEPIARAASDQAVEVAAGRIKDLARLRALGTAAQQIAVLARAGRDVGSVLQQTQQILGQAIDAARDDLPQVRPQLLDLRQAATRTAPARHWFIDHWLGATPTLFAAGGGVGKTLLAQQVGTALALGCDFLGKVCAPARSMIWACEDDVDELWRRQARIADHFHCTIDAPEDRLILQSRCGVEDNVLMALDHGRLVRTPVYQQLRQQVNDLDVDVLWLDNIGHLFGGDEINRGQVTTFVNAMAGLVIGRPFAVVLLGHVARSDGSEFAGSAAWENACRARWFLGNRPPGKRLQKDDDSAVEDDARFLVRGKANYARAGDFVPLRWSNGAFVEVHDAPVERELEQRAQERKTRRDWAVVAPVRAGEDW